MNLSDEQRYVARPSVFLEMLLLQTVHSDFVFVGLVMKLNRVFSVGVLTLGLGLISGCGPEEVKIDPAASSSPTVAGKDQIKERLQAIVDSGSGGSAVGGIREALLELKKTESSLADSLLKDLDALEKLQDPNQVKGMAQKMKDKIK